MICPKCQYEAQEHDSDMLEGVCPACGIAYAKWQVINNKTGINESVEQAKEPLLKSIYYYIFFMPSDRDESAFWGHSVLFAWFFIWG
jgi:hypothetical protein